MVTETQFTNQGQTIFFGKTCHWASGVQKSLAQRDGLVVPYHDGRGLAIEV